MGQHLLCFKRVWIIEKEVVIAEMALWFYLENKYYNSCRITTPASLNTRALLMGIARGRRDRWRHVNNSKELESSQTKKRVTLWEKLRYLQPFSTTWNTQALLCVSHTYTTAVSVDMPRQYVPSVLWKANGHGILDLPQMLKNNMSAGSVVDLD